jgi:hypothetical protein
LRRLQRRNFPAVVVRKRWPANHCQCARSNAKNRTSIQFSLSKMRDHLFDFREAMDMQAMNTTQAKLSGSRRQPQPVS